MAMISAEELFKNSQMKKDFLLFKLSYFNMIGDGLYKKFDMDSAPTMKFIFEGVKNAYGRFNIEEFYVNSDLGLACVLLRFYRINYSKDSFRTSIGSTIDSQKSSQYHKDLNNLFRQYIFPHLKDLNIGGVL